MGKSSANTMATHSMFPVKDKRVLQTMFRASGCTMLAAGMVGTGLLYLKSMLSLPLLSLIAMPCYGVGVIAGIIFLTSALFTLMNSSCVLKSQSPAKPPKV